MNIDNLLKIKKEIDGIKEIGDAYEKLISEALQRAKGNQSQAARSLEITERHLRYKLKKYGMK